LSGPFRGSSWGVGEGRIFHFPEALAGQLDAIGVMDEAIENGVGDGGIADDFVPAVDWDLAGDDDRTHLMAVIDDLKQIAALVSIECFRPPIVVCGRRPMARTFDKQTSEQWRSYVRPRFVRNSIPRALMKSDDRGFPSKMRALRLRRLAGLILVFG
jgi:hypothetical protein